MTLNYWSQKGDYRLDISDAIALIVALATILLHEHTIEYNNNSRLTDAFNKIYIRTFSLREEISRLTNEKNIGDFYYELDTILTIPTVQEYILDYLTELENFFNIIKWPSLASHTFGKLISKAFYQRIAMLYIYIIYIKNQSGNSKMFVNYCKTVKKMHKHKKIKTQLKEKSKICYVGIRESDIFFASNYFKKSICLFTANPKLAPFSTRMNQNIGNKEILPYYSSKLEDICKSHPKYSFMFYNQNTAFNYSSKILQNSICVNNKEILTLLNNKLSMKKWLADKLIPFIPYETFIGRDIFLSTLTAHFNDVDSFVIQQIHGGGGIGTFFVDRKSFLNVSKKLNPSQNYLVMPYVDNISANTHIFISPKQTVLSPGSIQVIERIDHQICYCGCDYISFRSLSTEIKEKIKQLSLKIADCLREEGYCGVAGIDFIIDNSGQVFCAEINSRFQASSILLDCYFKNNKEHLEKMEAKSCFELNKMAFSGCMITTLHYDTQINFSCYYYYNDINVNTQFYIEKSNLLRENGAEVHLDGMEYYVHQNKINETSYMFRAIFPHAISKISPDMKLWISDNVRITSKPNTQEKLKISLLNQGIRLKGSSKDLKKGSYESIDILLKANDLWKKDMFINCAYNIHLSKYSPYELTISENICTLYYYNEELAKAELDKNVLASFSECDKKILYIATDRLRIKLVDGCENKNMGKGCKFCDLPISNFSFTFQQISDALEHLKENQISFRHILIGGGSCLTQDSWKRIINICNMLKDDPYFCDKPISIMTILPPIEILPQLKAAGVEEVAFNIEIANDNLASLLMPGKRSQGKGSYYEILRAAVQTFGVGNVRSALVVGLDKENDLYNEIITLADMEVIPCLSAFRALPNSDFEGELGPSNEYLQKVYQNAMQLLSAKEGGIQELGPRCPACRNNMLIF